MFSSTPTKSIRKTGLMACAASAALALSGCATMGSIPGPSAPITQQEAQQGSEAHPQLLQEFGGAMSGPQANYVVGVGQNIAVQSQLAGAQDAFTVTLLDSAVNNAFAIPGGYVYVTRQLVGLMNNEAELAGVMGHEVGHVAARHSQRRAAKAQNNSIFGAIGAILSGVLLGNSELGRLGQQVSMQAAQAATLSYSRSQELEADTLGIQYLSRANYDPRAMSTVLGSLAQQNALDAQLQGRDSARLPEWASTHPDPASRTRDALAKANGLPGTVTNRDTFLTRIDGLMYGDNPRQGVIEGRQFLHPDLRLAFTAPQGFYLSNGSRAVSIAGDGGQGQLTFASYNGNLDNYVRQVFSSLSDQQQIAPQQLQRTTVNGIPAAYGTARVNNGQAQVDVVVYAYEFDNSRAYHFVTVTQAGRSNPFVPMFQSMRRLSASEASGIVARRIDVVTVGRNDSVASLSRRMAYTNGQEARFRVLNGLSSGEQVRAGQKVKIVVR